MVILTVAFSCFAETDQKSEKVASDKEKAIVKETVPEKVAETVKASSDKKPVAATTGKAKSADKSKTATKKKYPVRRRPHRRPPRKPVTAEVLGKKITAPSTRHLTNMIMTPLLAQYAKNNKIVPEKVEIDTFLKKIEEKEKQQLKKLEERQKKLEDDLKAEKLTEKQRKRLTNRFNRTKKRVEQAKKRMSNPDKKILDYKNKMATRFITNWKISKSLYAKYGGPVISYRNNAIPVGAFNAFLKEQEKKGAFKISDKKVATTFWKSFGVNPRMKVCTKDEAKKLLSTPWWEKTDNPISKPATKKAPAKKMDSGKKVSAKENANPVVAKKAKGK